MHNVYMRVLLVIIYQIEHIAETKWGSTICVWPGACEYLFTVKKLVLSTNLVQMRTTIVEEELPYVGLFIRRIFFTTCNYVIFVCLFSKHRDLTALGRLGSAGGAGRPPTSSLAERDAAAARAAAAAPPAVSDTRPRDTRTDT